MGKSIRIIYIRFIYNNRSWVSDSHPYFNAKDVANRLIISIHSHNGKGSDGLVAFETAIFRRQRAASEHEKSHRRAHSNESSSRLRMHVDYYFTDSRTMKTQWYAVGCSSECCESVAVEVGRNYIPVQNVLWRKIEIKCVPKRSNQWGRSLWLVQVHTSSKLALRCHRSEGLLQWVTAVRRVVETTPLRFMHIIFVVHGSFRSRKRFLPKSYHSRVHRRMNETKILQKKKKNENCMESERSKETEERAVNYGKYTI